MSNELRDIATALERIQRDIRSIAETLHDQKSESPVFDRIEQIKRLHDNGLGGSQISELLDIDYWIVKAVINAYEEDKGDE